MSMFYKYESHKLCMGYIQNYPCIDDTVYSEVVQWASKEIYHFLKAKLTKIHIKINHIWTQIRYYSTP